MPPVEGIIVIVAFLVVSSKFASISNVSFWLPEPFVGVTLHHFAVLDTVQSELLITSTSNVVPSQLILLNDDCDTFKESFSESSQL